MRGAGTGPAITPAERAPGAAWLLDVTRLVARAGAGPATGIDRVEAAYLRHLLACRAPVFALARTRVGYLLLDRAGAAALAASLSGGAPGRWRAERRARRQAIARSLPAGLARMLARNLPPGIRYLNTGHRNLAPRSLAAIRSVPGARIAVLLHDTLPLDHPQWAETGMPARFAARLAAAGAAADLMIYPATATRAAAERHLAARGRVPPGLVAPLGVVPPTPMPGAPDALAPGLPPEGPCFVALGTIEPRKNHATLLDLWERLAREMPAAAVPALCIVGRRGWRNGGVFRRLDASPVMGRSVHELGPLPDGAAAALLARSAGLLFPSHAEGFGLPPMEAAALGVPVLSSDLPSLREVLGAYPRYADPADTAAWKAGILQLAEDWRAGRNDRVAPRLPDWQGHFDRVSSRV